MQQFFTLKNVGKHIIVVMWTGLGWPRIETGGRRL